MDMIRHQSKEEEDTTKRFIKLFRNTPIPDDEILMNLGLYLNSQNIARIIFFYEMYKKIVNTHGVIMEFGTRWGQTLAILSALRGIFEPFNRTRRIIGFDTFSGLTGSKLNDGKALDGMFGVTDEYDKYLEDVLKCQEDFNPISHIKKFDIIKGDVRNTLPEYLDNNKEIIISMAIFDMDIYEPTVETLRGILRYVHAGSILIFDDLLDEVFPGETIAVREVFDINRLKIKKIPAVSRISYIECEEIR